jgi:peptidoglycan/xylan/chitin deacetylase (PgdA/CDA1 family)
MFHKIEKSRADISFKVISSLYNIIDLNVFIQAVEKKNKTKLPPYSLIITFDDGHILNYDLLSVFRSYNFHPTIFLCAGIINTNRHFWFAYKQSAIPVSKLKKKSNEDRLKILSRIGFIQDKNYGFAQALTKDQINEMRSYVNFQSHTIFHPCLTKCNYDEAKEEILNSKIILERDYQLNINALAYPNGDYTNREIEICKSAGYKCAITVDAGYNTINSDLFRLKRLSVNDTTDINELIVKASGLWGFIKKFYNLHKLFYQ